MTLLLTRSDIATLAALPEVLAAVEGAFAAHGRGETQMPPKVYLDFPEHEGDLRAMPSAMKGAAGLKWVNSHPRNPERHDLPSVMGLYILSDPATALPLAVLDATLLTALRTGTAAAVASKHLARPGATTLGIVGAGVQAGVLIDAHRLVFPELEVVVADAVPVHAEAVAEAHDAVVGSVKAAAGCDIVCTATPVRCPIVRRAWLAEGAHVNAMGADAEGKQELDTDLMLAARVFVDDWEQASHSGEINVPLHTGAMTHDHIAGSLGAVVAGMHPGRGDAAITVFDSTGLAVQDLAVAARLVQAARSRGLGREIDFLA